METIKLPFYAKLPLVLLTIIASLFIFYLGQDIIVPLLMAFLFAILLRPVVQFFIQKLRFPDVLASIMSVLLFVTFIVGLFIFLSYQITDIASDYDKIEKNITIHISNIQKYVQDNFNVTRREQKEYLNQATGESMQKGKEILQSTLMSFTDTLLNLVLIPIYIFLILLYRTHFIVFLSKLFKKEDQKRLFDIISLIKVAVKSYILGLLFEMVIVSALTAIGLSIIGVKYAIFLGILTGLLNLIPYIGILVAGALTILVSLSGSPELSIMFGVIIVNVIVQLIDNNILVPMVVSSKVEINALASIVGIIIGGAIAGVSGMFLAIPVIAIFKVIFDRIESLEPWGYLMGDDLPKTYKWRNISFPLYTYSTPTVTHSEQEIKIEITKPSESEDTK